MIINLDQWKRERRDRDWRRKCLIRYTLVPLMSGGTDCGDFTTWKWWH